jgi:hypothetical protein
VTLTTHVTNAVPGLNVQSSGTGSLKITGTPTAAGIEKFSVTATDAAGSATVTNYSITVNPAITLSTTTQTVVASSFFDSAVYEFDANTGALLATLVAPNSQATLEGPSGMTVGPDGNLYFASEFNGSIVEYDFGTQSLSTFISASQLAATGVASDPSGVAFGPDGDLYVSLNGGQQAFSGGDVVRFDIGSSGGHLAYAGTFAVVDAAFVQPTEMTFGVNAGDTGSLYVSDAGTDTVVKITNAVGSSPSASTFVGAGSGGLNYPSGLTWSGGKLYVTDLGATSPFLGQVLAYNADGSFNSVFTQPSSALQFQFPSDTLFLPNGALLTADLGPTYPVGTPGVPPSTAIGTSGSISKFNAKGTFSQVLSAGAFPANPATGVTNFSPSQLVLDTTSPGSGSSVVLAQDTVGVPYDQTITANGGTGSVTLTVSNIQNAIAGLSIPGSGTGSLNLTGTPTSSGTETFTVTATDAAGGTTTITYSITVNGAVTLSPSTTTLPADTVNVVYPTQAITASGGTGNLTLTVSNIQHAIAGLSIGGRGTSNVSITGTPTASGTETFTVTATDAVGSSASTTYSITVNPILTTTTISSSANPSDQNQSVTFTATVTPQSAGPGPLTGTVTFYDGAITPADQIGTPQTVSGGVATFPTSSLSPGTHQIFARYNGDSAFAVSSTTSAVSQFVRTATTTSLLPTAGTMPFGDATTFTALVTGTPALGTPTGTVTFIIDGTPQSSPVNLVNGMAALTVNNTAIPLDASTTAHTVVARYNGSSVYAVSTAAASNLTVTPASTGTAVVASPFNAVYGQSVTFMATVTTTSPGSGAPTGAVGFYLDGANTPAQTIPLSAFSASGSQAGAIFTNLSAGVTHSVVAIYNGSKDFSASMGPAGAFVTVSSVRTTTTTTESSQFTPYGQNLTFTATVSTVTPVGSPVTGRVVFTVDGFNTAPITPTNGTASVSFNNLAPGLHTVTTSFTGTSNYANGGTTSPTYAGVVGQSGSLIVSDATSYAYGQAIYFVGAAYSQVPSNTAPTGNGYFFIDGVFSGPIQLNTNGQAFYVLRNAAPGPHYAQFLYGADAYYNFSFTPQAIGVTVNKAITATVVTTTTPTGVFGQSLTVSATVYPQVPGGPTPTGTVFFLVNGTAAGPVPLNASGVASYTLSNPGPGTYYVQAIYNGDGNYDFSATQTVTTLTVSKADTATTDFASSPNIFVGQAVDFTAVAEPLAPGAGTPTGQVQFFVDGMLTQTTNLNTQGQASFVDSNLGVGQHTIVAAYLGDGDFNGNMSAPLFVTTKPLGVMNLM